MERSETRVRPIAVVDRFYAADGREGLQDFLLGEDGELYAFADVFHLADPFCEDYKNNNWRPWSNGSNKRIARDGRSVESILQSSVVRYKDEAAYEFARDELGLDLESGENIPDDTGRGRFVMRYHRHLQLVEEPEPVELLKTGTG